MFKAILAPLLSLILIILGNGYFITFITMRLNSVNTSEFLVGCIHSAFYAGFLAGALKIEPLINRVGHIRSFSIFASLFAATIILHGFYIEPITWIVIRFIGGICIASLYVIIESWLLSVSNIQNRGAILSIYMLALYASQALGQHFIKIIPLMSLAPFLLTALFASISIVPVSITNQDSPPIQEFVPTRIFEIFKVSPLGFGACFASGLILSCIYSFLPNFSQDNGLSVSWIMFWTICGGFVLQYPIGKLSDVYQRRYIIGIISFASIVPCIFISLLPNWAYSVMFFSFFLGGFTFTIYPVAIAHVCDHIKENKVVAATSILTISYSLGAIIGPLLTSLFIKTFNSTAIFLYIFLVAAVLGLSTIYSIYKKAIDKYEHESAYVPVPAATIHATELDPRQPDIEPQPTTES